MAMRIGEVGYDQLHHFVAGVWDSAPLEAALLKKADGLVGDKAGFLVIDDTALPKKGYHSAGVAPQYALSLGKTANCQSLVSVTLASREVPVMVGLRLFLPESWTNDLKRRARARVPKNRQAPLTQPEIAIEEIDRVIASGSRFGCVLADSGYGSSGPFRQALSDRFAARRVRVADGHKHRMLDNRMQCMPGDEVWLVGERRSTGEQKYYVSNLPADASLKTLAATIKPDGFASRRISSSKKSSASTTSKEDPGLDYTDTR
jgi:SRSO17 transposase